LNGLLYFVGYDAVHGKELWVSDGTVAGTHLLVDINPGPADSFHAVIETLDAVGGFLCFAADDGSHGIEPWRTDGTSLGTTLLSDVSPGPASSSPFGFVPFQTGVLFSANG